MLPDLAAQAKTGIENYTSLVSGEKYVWMPVVHHQGKKGLYTEMRYNYEAPKTASVYLGKSFSREAALSYEITPMAGFVFGEYTGASLAMNVALEHKKIFFSSQTQYTMNKDNRMDNFFFNWSELGYQPVKWFYTGVSAQLTKLYKNTLMPEYGLMLGLVIRKITIPVYVFNPLGTKKNYIIGINAAW